MIKNNVNIENKKILFQYKLIDEYIAGIQLLGSEVKSIRNNKFSISESFCQIKNNEIYILNMYISEYGSYIKNHDVRRERKLLLNKNELLKLSRKMKNSNLTIVPKSLFISKKGYVKIKIFLAQGRKLYDKRELIRKRDIDRDNKKILKY